MAGNVKIRIRLTTVPCEQRIDLSERLLHVLVRSYSARLSVSDSFAALIPDQATGFSIDELKGHAQSIASLLRDNPAILLQTNVRISEEEYAMELYCYPVHRDRYSVEAILDSSLYEALYSGLPPEDDVVNEAIKDDILRLCLEMAGIVGAIGFKADVDTCGMLAPLEEELLTLSLLSPASISATMELSPAERNQVAYPGLLTGVRNDVFDAIRLRQYWGIGPEVYETIGGYIVLDLLQPDLDDSSRELENFE